MKVYDNLAPDNFDIARIIINTVRNPGAPVFGRVRYQENVNEYHNLINVVLNVTATDSDNVSNFPLPHLQYWF